MHRQCTRTTEPAKRNCFYVVELTYITVDGPPLALFIRRNRDQRAYRPADASLRRRVPSYEPGAWSRFYVLAYVTDIECRAVFTVRSNASQALGPQLRLYTSGVLSLAQRDAPDLPPSAFWLTIYPGPVESRGEAGNASVITPPLIRLPDPGDEVAVAAWLDANFVGQELLDRFAQFLPEIERFRGASGLGADPL